MPKHGWKVLALVVLVFLGLEGVTRVKLFPASKDLRRFGTYPARARALIAKPGRHLAFVGNSLTERGIDLDQLRGELPASMGPVVADVFVADGSHINTWYWMIEREFYQQELVPDLVVLNFYEKGLEDGNRLELGRLAQFFTTRDDWKTLFKYDITTLEQRADFVLSSFWATFAVRDRIKERVLDLVPGYQPYTEVANALNLEDEKRAKNKGKPAVPAVATRETLARFLAEAKAHQLRVLFVAFPSLPPDPNAPAHYDVPLETTRMINDAGMLYVDLRDMPELDPKRHYVDDIHLNEEGRRIYTHRLASELAQVWLPTGEK